MNENMLFLKSWWEDLANDEHFNPTEQEKAYIAYAVAQYSFYGKKIDLGEVFGAEFRMLNGVMPGIYSQMDRINNYKEQAVLRNQKYDNEAIRALAAQGKTQKDICIELGYDVTKSRSLSSNAGYKAGREEYIQKKKCAENKNVVGPFNF